MCKIFGISSEREYVINDYLRRFYLDSTEHPHGWGLAVIDNGHPNIEKEPLQATKSNYLKERLSQKISAGIAFGHIRLATVGNVEYKNCHPYTGRDESGRMWTLVHNGTIFDYDILNPYFSVQNGDTDSERILLYIIDQVNRYRRKENTEKGLFRLIDGIVSGMSRDNKLNLLFSDGKYVFVHTNCPDAIHYLDKDGTILFSTSRLSHEEWKPLPMTTLFVYRDGRLVYEGSDHGNVYVENEENLKYLYQIFSGL